MILWILVILGTLVQFLLEVTLGRTLVAPAVLVPLLVYLGIYRDDYWNIEGAFWSGFMLDLLTHHPPGTSSLAMMAGIAFSRWVLSVTTGAVRMTFVANAMVACLASDLIFVLIAASPPGSGFGLRTLLLLPRAIFPLLIYLLLPLISAGRTGRPRVGLS